VTVNTLILLKVLLSSTLLKGVWFVPWSLVFLAKTDFYYKMCHYNYVVFFFFYIFQFKVNGEWWTWIDYDKFHELVKKYYSTDGAFTFTAEVN
jgi:hypothetical protein